MTLEDFKKDCNSLSPEIIVQKNLIEGDSYFFRNLDAHQEFLFKKELAESLDVHIRNIAVVGSGKLGFSIKPDKDDNRFYEYKSFDYDFNLDANMKKSDLDVAIVSELLFDKLLLELYRQSNSYTADHLNWGNRKSFAYYILKGWFRKDFMPLNFTISPGTDLVVKKYEMKYKREVNIGIYKSWYYFENYHRNNIYNIQLNNIANG